MFVLSGGGASLILRFLLIMAIANWFDKCIPSLSIESGMRFEE